jgi:hypothetical protein
MLKSKFPHFAEDIEAGLNHLVNNPKDVVMFVDWDSFQIVETTGCGIVYINFILI